MVDGLNEYINRFYHPYRYLEKGDELMLEDILLNSTVLEIPYIIAHDKYFIHYFTTKVEDDELRYIYHTSVYMGSYKHGG